MSVVVVPAALSRCTGGASVLPVTCATVGEAIEKISARFPGLNALIRNSNGLMRGDFRFFVGNTDVAMLDGLATKLSANDEISLVPCVAGAAGPPLSGPECVISPERGEAAVLFRYMCTVHGPTPRT